MRLVRDAGELAEAIERARGEATGAFGDDTLLLERYIERPRHIEIQILGDTHGNVVHLWERECSIQRRHQKIIEEAPSPALDDARARRDGRGRGRARQAPSATSARARSSSSPTRRARSTSSRSTRASRSSIR